MATSARLGIEDPEAFDRPRHSALVRITHWITTLAFFGLLASGIAILLAHPRLYWGETGTLGTPSLVDLPLPLVLVGQSGWGRYLHFLSAWACVLTGLVYVLWGLFTWHFRDHLLPNRDHSGDQERYNTPQRLSYLAVVFLLFPLIILTGLAMSPALASVFPALVIVFGGHQSARTIHFFVANLLVLFLLVHVTKVGFAGFSARVRAMVTGRTGAQRRVFRPSRLSRRKLVTSGVAVAAGASGLAVLARVADRYDLIPPDHGGLFGAGETLTYAA
ncbi:MAG: cytochrome b/b6 domain-containing protein, partial [Acidobacteria bacterium Pan2503]|nr:cytochrome b/b6 domain-containing protein [Candidatus Acidoferrum panamensis]